MRIVPITTSSQYTRLNNKIKKDKNSISFKGLYLPTKTIKKIKKRSFKTAALAMLIMFAATFINSCKKVKEAYAKHGYVEPIQKNFSSKENALKYAIDRIKAPLNIEEPYEYSVILDYDNYRVISEKKGSERSVANYPLEMALCDKLHIPRPKYIHLHGHPEDIDPKNNNPHTQPFSFQDFRAFNADDSYLESYVVNKKGQYCLFKKNENYKKLTDEELNEFEKRFNFHFYASWPNPIEVKKDGKVIHTFYDKQGLHKFWDEASKKYNFEYKTTFGQFEGIDAYEKSYYPEYYDKGIELKLAY